MSKFIFELWELNSVNDWKRFSSDNAWMSRLDLDHLDRKYDNLAQFVVWFENRVGESDERVGFVHDLITNLEKHLTAHGNPKKKIE
jgi:hypothetical protein